MNIKCLIQYLVAVIVVSSTIPTTVTAGDWLDVYPSLLDIPEGPHTIKGGDRVHFRCRWTAAIAYDHNKWVATGGGSSFRVEFFDRGYIFYQHQVQIPPGTQIKIGKSLHGEVIAPWDATHSGPNDQPYKATITCSVNLPKTISDANLSDNQRDIQVIVQPPYPKVQPGNGWPAPAPKIEGTRRMPKTMRSKPGS